MADVLVPPSPFLAVKQILTSRRATRQCLQLRPRIRHQVEAELGPLSDRQIRQTAATDAPAATVRKSKTAALWDQPSRRASLQVACGVRRIRRASRGAFSPHHKVAVETTNPANSPTRKNEIAAKLVRPNKCAKVSVAAGPNPSPTESHGVSFPSKKNICTHCE